jgi:hypothetical protein
MTMLKEKTNYWEYNQCEGSALTQAFDNILHPVNMLQEFWHFCLLVRALQTSTVGFTDEGAS